MRYLFINIIILAGYYQATFSQSCLPEGITFTTQAQIDNFQTNYPGCSIIEGNVYIGEFGPSGSITNLAGLSSITRIGGYLNIHYLSNLQNMNGLENLTYIGGYLEFTWNNHLTDIDGLANLDSIGGELFVRYSFFDDLTGFASLSYVGGDIRIVQNTGIDNFDGMESLKVVRGSLDVADNENVYDINGFNAVDSIYGRLYLRNPEATSISGFNNLKFVGNNVIVEENAVLTGISGISQLNYIGNDLKFINNFVLSEVIGFNMVDSIGGSLVFYQVPLLSNSLIFSNLVHIGGKFEIAYCNSFSALSDFQNLQSVGGGIRIYNNDNLLGLEKLENLTSVGGDLVLYYNDTLTSLAGLENINPNSVAGLEITYNPLLSECDIPPICNYLLSPNGTVQIYHNAIGCNRPPEIAASCGNVMPCLPDGNYYFNSQQDIDNFSSDYPGCTDLDGLVEINGNDIHDLEPLNVVYSINGTLHIASNYYLFVLYGLHNLASVTQDFILEYNGSLTDLDGLDMLTSIGGTFFFRDNSSLQSLDGIENLQEINGNLTIYSNEMLNDLSALSNMTSLGGYLNISYNDLLNDLIGFSNLTAINGELDIYGNDILTNLEGLENINPSSITHLGITGNPQLTECAILSICEYIANPGGTIDISYNAAGCNSVEEVDSICFPVSINDFKELPDLTLYPNPASEEFMISAANGLSVYSISIKNSVGQLLLNQSWNPNPVNVVSLSPGLYFVEIRTNLGITRRKIFIR